MGSTSVAIAFYVCTILLSQNTFAIGGASALPTGTPPSRDGGGGNQSSRDTSKDTKTQSTQKDSAPNGATGADRSSGARPSTESPSPHPSSDGNASDEAHADHAAADRLKTGSSSDPAAKPEAGAMCGRPVERPGASTPMANFSSFSLKTDEEKKADTDYANAHNPEVNYTREGKIEDQGVVKAVKAFNEVDSTKPLNQRLGAYVDTYYKTVRQGYLDAGVPVNKLLDQPLISSPIHSVYTHKLYGGNPAEAEQMIKYRAAIEMTERMLAGGTFGSYTSLGAMVLGEPLGCDAIKETITAFGAENTITVMGSLSDLIDLGGLYGFNLNHPGAAAMTPVGQDFISFVRTDVTSVDGSLMGAIAHEALHLGLEKVYMSLSNITRALTQSEQKALDAAKTARRTSVFSLTFDSERKVGRADSIEHLWAYGLSGPDTFEKANIHVFANPNITHYLVEQAKNDTTVKEMYGDITSWINSQY